MKELNLTKEHKEKIIEMCKKLFPKTPYISFYNDYDDKQFLIGNYDQGEKWDDNKPQIIENFHWFEFCINELLPKLYKQYKSVSYLKLDLYGKTYEEIYNEEENEFQERVGEGQGSFNWFTDNTYTINWFSNTFENPSFLFYKDKYYFYGKDGNRKSSLSELKEVNIKTYIDSKSRNEFILNSLNQIVIENKHPVDYLYKEFQKLTYE